jgi:hypothetical protein
MSCSNPTGHGTAEADAYDRLIAAARSGSIGALDPDTRRAVDALLDADDQGGEYGRVVAEHAALVGSLDQLGGRP